MYIPFFIYTLICGNTRCFSHLAIMSNAGVFKPSLSILLKAKNEMKSLGHLAAPCLISWGTTIPLVHINILTLVYNNILTSYQYVLMVHINRIHCDFSIHATACPDQIQLLTWSNPHPPPSLPNL
jgi:hypothetical protein